MKHYTLIQDEAIAKLNVYRETADTERKLRTLAARPKLNINGFTKQINLFGLKLKVRRAVAE